MSGKYEKEKDLERKIKNRLEDAPDIVNEYYYSLIGAGKSYETTYKYINVILSFIQYTFNDMCDDDFYKKVKSVHINKYIASMRTKTVNGQTERTSDSIQGVHWSALNSFFQFLVPNYISSNPVANTKRPRNKDNPQVTYLNTEEISKVLRNVEAHSPEKYKNRDLCILKLGFSTGLRVSAIIQIDVDDIDFNKNQIRVTEKGDYDQYIMFGENLKAQLKAWLVDREKYFGHFNTNALFVSQKGKRISDDMIGVMFKKYATGVTDKHVHPHVMRHSCATNLYEATGDIYLCSKQLHHSNVSTMQRYAELFKEKQNSATNILDNMINTPIKSESKMYQHELKEGFIQDYLKSRITPSTELYELFINLEHYESQKKKDCSQFTKDEVLNVFTEFTSRSMHTLLNNVVILKSYCRYMQYYHNTQTTNAYEEITTKDLRPCVNAKTSRLLSKDE